MKIDRAFIANLATRRDGLAIVSTIISLAHSLKLKVVVEGRGDRGAGAHPAGAAL